MTTATTSKAVSVGAYGPEADFDDRACEEIPVWFVQVEDDDGEAVGKTYRCRSQRTAVELMLKIARDRRLPWNNETTCA